ncbi:efflux RND transporter periplasmic adaptor subunit [Plastoroseomonas hellenica]|uniref:efflux RND transporter periplasmic adaptor subunit n=1 Tax=Plastoroseomonas hellenica TaxID=2687306 RepID=UPI001BA4FA1F|nr:efflux RND transporter periplasmic adaptor subunit [Plastoroseomonas hellenica]MBR0642133.1 efflux RND transporter periplasmic adaptor subunit [Plastoroseomonas hellenica]
MSAKALLLATTVAAAGFVLGGAVTPLFETTRSVAAFLRGSVAAEPPGRAPAREAAGHGHAHGPGEAHAEGETEGAISLTEEQIQAAGIGIGPVGGGSIARRVAVPGTIAPNADRLARVAARVTGTVVELRRRLGDSVAASDVLAVVESREIAEAKADYLAMLRTEALARNTAERERRLFERRVSAEQDLLKAQTEAEEARIRLDLARAKLAALGLSAEEIEALPQQPIASLRRQEIRSPIAGRVTERRLDLGAAVAADTLAFVVADLSTVWVEMAVPGGEVGDIREGQAVVIRRQDAEPAGEGRIIFASPVLDTETRTARVVAELPNPSGVWRPGSFVTAAIATEEQEVEILVPQAALQTMGAETVVFVRTEQGFERREVVVGRRDEQVAEIVFGLDAGERIAISNTFVLKAEIGKAEAAHGHAH